jgi:hypothetical protein
MAWLWNSWEEYSDYVQPVSVRRPLFNIAKKDTAFKAQREMFKAFETLIRTRGELYKLGFTGRDNDRPPTDIEILSEARGVVRELIHAGEELLLYHKRLAETDSAYGLLSQHDMVNEWERYGDRVFIEIDQLVTDTDELIAGYREIENEDEKFLLSNVELPTELESDFRMARNLFSIGLDEVAVFSAARGLERVLRAVARLRKIMMGRKNQIEPACDVDLFDLIETMSRIYWKRSGSRLITPQTTALLHYLRTLRNATAHPTVSVPSSVLVPREMAKILTETANRLWKDVTQTRAKFRETTIQKNW